MTIPTLLPWIDAFVLLTLFVGAPAIAAAIGYGAYRGRFKTFSRETFWTASMLTGLLAGLLIVLSIRIHPDVRTWLYGAQAIGFVSGAIGLGISSGFVIAIFTCQRQRYNSPASEIRDDADAQMRDEKNP
ncbi:MAG: hypothetical protein ABSD87_11935 [Candidatus Acidiferrales bacterium]|jgi:hypothetical protein